MADQDLMKFVQDARQRGYEDDYLKEGLRRGGYRDDEIQEALGGGVSTSQEPQEFGLIGQIIRGAVRPQVEEGEKAWQALRGQGEFAGMGGAGRTSEAVGHGLASLIPFLGPQAASLGESIGNRDVGGSVLNALGLGGQLFGEEAVKALAAPLRQSGRNLFEDLLNLPRGQKNPSPQDLVNLGLEGKYIPTQKSLGRLRQTIDDAMQGAKGEIAQMPTAPIDMAKATNPLASEIAKKNILTLGDLPQTKALLDRLEHFQSEVGPTIVGGRDVSRYGGQLPLARAQEIKQEIWKTLSDKSFQAELAQMPGRAQGLLLNGVGLKDAIEDVVGPSSNLAEYNQKAHVAMSLYQKLNDLASKDKSFISKYGPAFAGGAAYMGAQKLGGSSEYHVGMTATVPAMAYLATKMLMKDPAVSARFAQALAGAGEGALSKFISQVPKMIPAMRSAMSSSNPSTPADDGR